MKKYAWLSRIDFRPDPADPVKGVINLGALVEFTTKDSWVVGTIILAALDQAARPSQPCHRSAGGDFGAGQGHPFRPGAGTGRHLAAHHSLARRHRRTTVADGDGSGDGA